MHDLAVTTPGPHRDFRAPGAMLPEGSCDAHVHIFGPHARFPFAQDRAFTPEDVTIDDLQRMHATMGFSRSVLVQSAAHGHDHAAVLDALERHPGRYRAVALLTADTSPAVVGRMDEAGFCGARVHFTPHLGDPPTADEILRLCDLIGPAGWHLEAHVVGDGLDAFADMFDRIPIRVVMDHMGRVDPSPGVASRGLRIVKDLLDEDDFWIKLSGADRVSREIPSMADGLALARSLFAHRPDRCVWGSDFPHPNSHGFVPWDHDLVDGIDVIAPSAAEKQRLLVDNPNRCFGFDAPHSDDGGRS